MYTIIIMKHSINMLYTCRQICYKSILFHSKVKYINFCSTQSRYTQNICLTISWLNCFFKSILEPTFNVGYVVIVYYLFCYINTASLNILTFVNSYTFTSKCQQENHTVPIPIVFFQ